MRLIRRGVRRLLIAVAVSAGIGALAVVALTFYQPRWLIAAAARTLPGILFSVHTDSPLVALTFDDGPDPAVTPRVLEILRRERTPATWFITGSRAAEHPELLRQIVADGHQIANHMWGTTPAWTLSLSDFAASVEATARVAPAHDLRTFLRPASGWIRPSAASWSRRNGYRVVLGSVYANDPLKPPPAYIEWAITRMAGPGDIVVLHVGAERGRTAEALPGIIKSLRAKRLRPVRISELLDSADIATSPRKRN